MDDIARVLLDWRVLLIAGCLLLAFPLVFYLSSLDKTPVKVKRITMRAKRVKPGAAPTRRESETNRRAPDEGRRGPRKRPPPASAERRAPPAGRERATENEPSRFEEPDTDA